MSKLREMVKRIIKEETENYDADFDFEEAYNDAPDEVKDLLDEFGDEQDYREHQKLKKKLNLLGYDYDFDLSGTATYLGPLKK